MTLTEVLLEPDDRGRVTLGRLTDAPASRYLARRLPDGTIVLQPAVVLTEQALEQYVRVRARRLQDEPTGRPLREALEVRNVKRPSKARAASVRAELDGRRGDNARTLADASRASDAD